MNRKLVFAALPIFLFVLASCEKRPEIIPEYPDIEKAMGGVFILNEGNFQFGNASLDYVDFEEQKMSSGVFETVNKRQLGDVLQSMTVYNNSAYLVVNNSQKIEVINVNDFSSTATITGFKSPRYMLVANATRAYVSEYYNGGVRIIDLPSNTLRSTIPLRGNLDELLQIGSKIYVTNSNGYYLYIIDTGTDQVTDSIEVGYGSNSLRLDKNGKLWVLCAGRQDPYLNGSLVRINPADNSIEQKLGISRQNEHGPMKLRISGNGSTLYWLNRDVYQHEISSSTLALMPLVTSLNNSFWGIAVDTVNRELYVSDAIDFVQKSSINRYNEEGALKGSFKAGIISGDFYFYYPK